MGKYIYRWLITLVLIVTINVGNGQDRRIKPGDIVDILVNGNEALTQSVVVNNDGTVDYPALYGLPVDGLTLNRFQEILVAQLSRYMPATPLIYVRFGASYPIQVTVLGQIARPGQYPIANTSTIQGAIGAAGGLIPGAQLSKIRLIRMVGEEKIQQTVDLEKFSVTGDPALLPELRDGDTIVILGNPLATNVKVLGSVENPGNYDVFFQTTVLDVIYMAGGFTNDANLNKIKIISSTGEGTREVKINIDELLKGVNPTKVPLVSPGDIVYIPQRWFTWSKTLAFIRDITTFVTLYYLIQMSNR